MLVVARSGRFVSVARRLGAFVSRQAALQVLTAVTGLWVIRWTTKEDYALFALANSLQGIVTILADSGLGSALLSRGGAVYTDPDKLGVVLRSASALRARAALTLGPLVGLVGFVLMRQTGASVLTTAAYLGVIMLGLAFQIQSSLLESTLRLHSRVIETQDALLTAALLRVALLASAGVFGLSGLGALLCGVPSFLVQALLLQRYARNVANLDAQPSDEVMKYMREVTRSTFANTAFHCFQSQATLGILAIAGTATRVADLAALGRITVLLAIPSQAVTQYLIPRFARAQGRQRLRRCYVMTIGATVGIALAFVGGVFVTAPWILRVLGANYAGLELELVLASGLAALQLLAGVAYSLNYARSWMKGVWIQIPVVLATQLVTVLLVDVSTVRGALALGAAASLFPLLNQIATSFRRLKAVEASLEADPC
jgi:O-antigen/teichoic acid export membrane protein